MAKSKFAELGTCPALSQATPRAEGSGSPSADAYHRLTDLFQFLSQQLLPAAGSHLCRQFLSVTPRDQQRCHVVERDIREQQDDEAPFNLVSCRCGMACMVVPVRYQKQVTDTLVVSGLLMAESDRSTLRTALESAGMDPDEARMRAESVPVVRPADLERWELFVSLWSAAVTNLLEVAQRCHRIDAAVDHQARLASLGQLASGVAHEINNRLTPVIGYLDMLSEEELPEHIHHYVDTVREAMLGIQPVMDGLLSLACPPQRVMRVMDLGQVVASTLQLVEYAFAARGIHLTLRTEGPLPPLIGDAALLQQALLNLLVNAKEAMPHGGSLNVSMGEGDGQVWVRIADSGCGMDAETVRHAFDPFFTTKPQGEGTGLGLPTTLRILEAHNGRIDVQSTPGVGSVFTLWLPVPTYQEGGAKSASESEQPFARRALPALHFLVADADLQARQALATLLAGEGHTFVATSSASDLLGVLAESGDYDVLLLDVSLPQTSILALWSQICQVRPHLARNTLFMAGRQADGDLLPQVEALGQPVLRKPFLPADLAVGLLRVVSTASSDRDGSV